MIGLQKDVTWCHLEGESFVGGSGACGCGGKCLLETD